MKSIKLLIGLGFIVAGFVIGGLIPIGRGNVALIGTLVGIVACCLLIDYKKKLPTTYTLTQAHQDNDGINEQAIENATLKAREAAMRGGQLQGERIPFSRL